MTNIIWEIPFGCDIMIYVMAEYIFSAIVPLKIDCLAFSATVPFKDGHLSLYVTIYFRNN
jgi:hypothetical protein